MEEIIQKLVNDIIEDLNKQEERNKFINDMANSLKNVAYYRFVYHNAKNEKDKIDANRILGHEYNHIDRYADHYYINSNLTKKEMIDLCKQIKRILKIKYKKQLKQMIKAYKESESK